MNDEVEHQRLRDAVIEAAIDFWELGGILYQAKLDAAVEDLLEFEGRLPAPTTGEGG